MTLKDPSWRILAFWGLFALVNSLLFLPNYLSFFDFSGLSSAPTGSWTGRPHLFFQQQSLSLFHLAAELLFLITTFLFVRGSQSKRWLRRLTYTIFILLFLYNLYYEFYRIFYGVAPSFLNDWILWQEVLPIFLKGITASLTLYYVLIFVGIIGLMACFIFLIKKLLQLFEKVAPNKWFRITLGMAWMVVIFFTFIRRAPHPLFAVDWITPRIIQSSTLQGADQYRSISQDTRYNEIMQAKLEEHPDVYLIFVESYGTVATESPELQEWYTDLTERLLDTLGQEGWQICSNYSISPVKGGRSWLAFTSAMSGLKVDNQVQYNDLVRNNFNFPNLPKFFSTQGYQTYRMSTMTNVDTDSLIPTRMINRFWGFNDWITYSDINYQGYQYDYLGGLPDQYALGYFDAQIMQQDDRPHFLFFITMTSHVPWYPPPSVADYWKDLDTVKSGPPLETVGETIERYRLSIDYEFRVLERFIGEKIDDDAIVVLVGDHQPPTLEYKIWEFTDDAATPVHIISKDSAFVQSFAEYGFTPGMMVDHTKVEYMAHQGLFSLLSRQLIQRYGSEASTLPTYYPQGLQIETEEEQ